MAKAGIQFSKKNEWYTPKEVVDFFGPFDYDPCTTKERAEYLGIPKYDTIETDGLKQKWPEKGKIWINPPFTKKFEFLKKAVEHTNACWGSTVYILFPIDSLTTKKFDDIIPYYYTVYLPNGRIKFEDGCGGASSPAFGSVVLELNGVISECKIIPWEL